MKKQDILEFINNLNDDELLITNEILTASQETNERVWLARKERVIQMINERFNDELLGVLDQEIYFQINDWGTISKETVYHEEGF